MLFLIPMPQSASFMEGEKDPLNGPAFFWSGGITIRSLIFNSITMKYFIKTPGLIILSILIFAFIKSDNQEIVLQDIGFAQKTIGLNFSIEKLDSMLDGLNGRLKTYEAIREYPLSNDIPPALIFNPIPPDFYINRDNRPIHWEIPENIEVPEDRDRLAFYSILELASLLKHHQITSTELTRFFINRLKEYGDTLKCVISITEKRALEQAGRADQEISGGNYKGPLHGIPFGVKDLLAVEGYPTTWGAAPSKNQVINETATVVKKLEEAGGILVAKLTLGALAWGDVWYGGKTRNPWDLNQGSSGSSAGSASATSAGLVPYSIGSETHGSIISPSTRCGTTGLRPSFGRVSRTGAMALSWSMDKLGPICRSALDCAIVFESILGKDEADQSLVEAAYNFNMNMEVSSLKVGYLKDIFDQNKNNRQNDAQTIAQFKSMGLELEPVSLPDNIPVNALSIILNAEAAAAFDELTTSGRDSMLVRQIKNAWPNEFRKARFIPAVEYINANRIRYVLIQEINAILKDYDAIITPTFGGTQVLTTNLTGHPCVVLPNGFDENNRPTSFSLIGNLFEEEKILRLAMMYQEETNFEDVHPPLFQ
jgi:Asp-tRNA(Asn)/Glu-tRNA(Gln) amidotransferase A subunit family amidase